MAIDWAIAMLLLLGRLTGMLKGLKLYWWTLFHYFSFVYQSTALSSRTVDGHQMYSGGSVVGKASTIDPEISPTTPVISQCICNCLL